jgi:hypothetical protein
VTCPAWCTVDHGAEPPNIWVHRCSVAKTHIVEVRLNHSAWMAAPRVELHNLDRDVVADMTRSILRVPLTELPAVTALMDSVGRMDVGNMLRKASELLAAETGRAESEAA